MERSILLPVLAATCFSLTGCDKDPISTEDALKIAALSQDADEYQNEFALAIRDLSMKDDCQPEAMREGGGFSRVTGDSYCGEPINSTRRWYYNPLNGNLSRIKAEM